MKKIKFLKANKYGKSKELIKICKEFDLISIDVFDTAIIRLTKKPEEIFSHMEKKLKYMDVENFKYKRIFAQKKAELKYKYFTTLEKIYKEFVEIYGIPYSVSERIKLIELEQELELCIANQAIVDLVKYCKKTGKIVVFTSDMYITAPQLSYILKEKGIYGYDDLFVSCDYGVTKGNRKLFQIIINKYGEQCEKFIHIGDTIRNDFFNSFTTKRFSSCLLARSTDDLMKKILIYSEKEFRETYEWGYFFLGPVIYGFCEWINQKYEHYDMQQMIFLTREGAFIKKIYDICIKKKGQKKHIFYVSRRSLMAAMVEQDWTAVCKYLINAKATLKDIQDMFHLSDDYINEIISLYDISKKTILKNIEDREKILCEIKKECISYSSEQRELLIKYIKQFNLSGNVGVVDIGWNGTMQHNLQKFIDAYELPVNLIGLYFGVYDSKKYRDQKYGFLCSGMNKKNIYHMMNATYLLEISLQERMGTVLEYRKNEDRVIPIIDSKKEIDSRMICDIQKGVYDCTRIITNYRNIFEYNMEYCKNNMFCFLDNPKYRFVRELGNIRWRDISSYNYIAKPDNIYRYLLSPKKILVDMKNSGWNSGFLLRLFKIPFPYFDLYEFLKKIMKGKSD